MADGHRKRVRDRFKEENIDTIPESLVLERIIHNVVARKDASTVARNLLREFGSLAQIIDAPEHELCKVDGIGPAAASFLNLIPAFYRKYKISKWGTGNKVFANTEDVSSFLHDRLIGFCDEAVVLLCLDSNFKFLSCKVLFEGVGNSVDINIRKLLDFALASNAVRAVLAHNHPDNNITPSTQDIYTTRRVYNAFHYANIRLDDHIIVTENATVSIARSGIIPNFMSGFDSPDDVGENLPNILL